MSTPKTSPLRVKKELIDSLRVTAALRGMSMSNLISEILSPVVFKMEVEELMRRKKKYIKQKKLSAGN